jgi:hypothetical protein
MKHLVPLFSVGVHRDITTTHYPQVPEYEIPVLQAIHGDSNVYPGEPTGQNAEIDADDEYDRLTRKYNENAVRDAYGVTARGDIRRAVLNASVGQVENENTGIVLEGPDSKPKSVKTGAPASDSAGQEAAGKPGAQWTKAQLLEYASAHDIDVDEDSTKAQILEAIKAAVPA